jgi:hypothetical protein
MNSSCDALLFIAILPLRRFGTLPDYDRRPLFMAGIHITDIEAAINFWRERKPSPDGVTLAPSCARWPRCTR